MTTIHLFRILPSAVLTATLTLTCFTNSSGQVFIPIDHKGELPSTHIGILPNQGQLTSLQGSLVPDIVHYSIQARPQMFFSKKNECS